MSELMQLEEQLRQTKEVAEFGELARKLYENHEFRKVIIDGFMLRECARYVQISCDPNLKSNEREDALAIAQAAGHLKRFLSVTVQMGDVAKDTIRDIEAGIERARQEEAE